MSRAATGTAAVAVVLALGALAVALDARTRAADAEAGSNLLRSSLDATRTRLDDVERQASAASSSLRASEERSAYLEMRLAGLEVGGSGRSAAPAREASDGGEAAAGAAAVPVPGAAPPTDGATAALRTEFKDLRRRYFKGEASADDQKRYWELAKTEGFLDGIIGEAEAAVAGNPEDIEGRMELSQDYIARLFTVPAGPEMGIWAAKAEGQWKEVLARDDRHWEARYSLATSWSRYPDFLNKGPDAVRELETLKRQQEGGPVEPRQAGVYLELGNLYKRGGNAAKQRETLEEGIRRHPEDEGLKKALEVLTAR